MQYALGWGKIWTPIEWPFMLLKYVICVFLLFVCRVISQNFVATSLQKISTLHIYVPQCYIQWGYKALYEVLHSGLKHEWYPILTQNIILYKNFLIAFHLYAM